MITAAAGIPTVELIKWNSVRTGTGRSVDLADEIDYLFTQVAALSDSDNINVPASVTGTAGSVTAVLTTLKGLIDANTNAINGASGLGSRVTALENTVGNSTAGLVKDVADLQTASANFAQKDGSDLTVTADSTGTTTGNVNTVLQNLFALVGNIKVPQILLFNTSSPAVGSLTSQEFLTNQKVKVKEIAIYTNVDATVATDISAEIEHCAQGATAYTSLNAATAITLTAGTTQRSTDVSSNNIIVNPGARLRLNITAFGSTNTVDVLNVRLILEPTL